MKTDEEMREYFMKCAGQVLSDSISEQDADDFASFITKNRVRLAEVVPGFNEACTTLSAYYVEKAEAIMLRCTRNTDGCGKCRGCVALKEARERLYAN